MENVGTITISDLSKAYYIYYKSNSKEEVLKAATIIENAPKDLKRRLETIKKRKQRLRRRLKILFDDEPHLYFLTLTFNDNSITKESYFINKFKRDLKKDCIKYIINQDFGIDSNFTNRVHYHCIINKKIKVLDYWNYGGFNIKQINKSSSSLRRIPDYLNKLVNHSLKESNKKLKVYYNL